MSDFVWTDELVKEFAHHCNKHGMFVTTEALMGKFKEEKTKRDWVILEFTAKYWGSDNVRFSRGYDGTYSAGINGVIATEPIEKLKANGVIHSVKRLSDGEVFSIGDEVEYSISGEKFDGKIDGFDVWQDSIMAVGEPLSFRINLKHLQKVVKPKPLFVTEDGVEIFKGVRFWAICKTNFEILECVFELTFPNDWITFSTKEKAEEYILMNKPSFSINELKEIVGKRDWIGRDFFIELAQKKLSK